MEDKVHVNHATTSINTCRERVNSLRCNNFIAAVYNLNNNILVYLSPATQLSSQIINLSLQRNSVSIRLTICVSGGLCAIGAIETEIAGRTCTVTLSKGSQVVVVVTTFQDKCT